LLGWETGRPDAVNLTAITNHGIVFRSLDTNVAAVDSFGNVTGVGPGKTSIVASYFMAGGRAGQSVTVEGVQPRMTASRLSGP
jgi:hypothetical protein